MKIDLVEIEGDLKEKNEQHTCVATLAKVYITSCWKRNIWQLCSRSSADST